MPGFARSEETTTKVLSKITIPVEPFNTRARDGVVALKMGAIVEETRPESTYVTGNDSGRGAVAVYGLADGSQIPREDGVWKVVHHHVDLLPDVAAAF